jgi:myo-inositol-1(or 4)-monophosphatase
MVPDGGTMEPMTGPTDQNLLTPENTDELSAAAAAVLGTRSPEDLRSTAVRIASEAAAHVRRARAGLHGRVDVAATKSSTVDPVTAVDRSSEDLIRARLGEFADGDAVLGEEEGGALADDRVTWVADPIDGTVNFIYGIPSSAVSVAAVLDGVPVAAAVADIVRQRVFSACVGGRAMVSGEYEPNGRATGGRVLQVRPSVPESLGSALVGTGFSYEADRRRQQAELLVDVLPRVRDIRRIGSAALDLCAVAAGSLDAYYEHGLGPWDHAAGALVAARAGAQVRQASLAAGSERGLCTFAAVPSVAGELADLVASVTFPRP